MVVQQNSHTLGVMPSFKNKQMGVAIISAAVATQYGRMSFLHII